MVALTDRYVVAGRQPWNRATFDRLAGLPGRWEYASTPEELTAALARGGVPSYVFFLHWSDLVPDSVTSEFECVCFHMTPLPLGRGGSPLQHLLLDGSTETTLTAFRMTGELDAGPVYLTRRLVLEGPAEAIYARADRLAAEMIQEIIAQRPEPYPQQGEPTFNRRRRPDESLLPGDADLDTIHDFIRMLDAPGYPWAYIDHGNIRIRLRRSVRYSDRIEVDATITIRPEEEGE